MRQKTVLTNDDVKRVAETAEIEARRAGWQVSIAIVDDSGTLLWFSRLDGAPLVSVEMAIAKANSAALGRRDTKAFEDMINGGRTAFLSAPNLKGMLEGGIPILHRGELVGAIGVAGGKSSEDNQIAKAAAMAFE